MNKQKLLAILLAASLVMVNSAAFCADNKTPSHNTTGSKQLKGAVEDYRAEYINKDWWGKFNDPILSGYIVKAAANNHDLKIATLRVSEAKALVRESLGKEFPSVDIGTSIGRERASGNLPIGSFDIPSYSESNILFPLNVNYELDLWRKNRDKTLGMAKELESIKYDEKAAYISLTSEVAAAYFNVVKSDKLINTQKEIIDIRKNILELTKEKNTYGLCPTSDVIYSDKALTEAESSLNDLEKQQSIFLNQLAILTGDSVDNSASIKRTSIDDIDIIKDLPLTVKAEIVQQRPDILKSEAELQKSRIDVKLARKDFLPDITLSGEYGFNADSLSKTFDWNSYVASFGVGLVQNIFAGGQKLARLKAKKYRYQEMLENYQKTILQSFQEVNDSLISLKTDSQKNKDNLSRINFELNNLDLINVKYEHGAIAYLDTLQYKERVLVLDKEQIQSKTDCLIDSLSLYKAAGGKLGSQ